MESLSDNRYPIHFERRSSVVVKTADGIRLEPGKETVKEVPVLAIDEYRPPALVEAMRARSAVNGAFARLRWENHSSLTNVLIDVLCLRVLAVPRSERWREAASTALLGGWTAPLWRSGHLPDTAIGSLRAEARAIHRQLVPLWRRRTRHGRVWSLDAALGDGLCLYDLVAADAQLAHSLGGVFDDERLNRVLRALHPAERQVVFAYAEYGGTWAEAAVAAGAADAEAFGERVRRKVRRLAAEQRRRMSIRANTSPMSLAP
ncbi:hypothetical protein [Streptomyces yangpuensis]|uniref:hypothetical protein n=1 Tax=Streptomyces yangpuensis TaxID=1648182 RepID=UPI003661FDA4